MPVTPTRWADAQLVHQRLAEHTNSHNVIDGKPAANLALFNYRQCCFLTGNYKNDVQLTYLSEKAFLFNLFGAVRTHIS